MNHRGIVLDLTRDMLPNICRLCLGHNIEMVDIFSGDYRATGPIHRKIHKLFEIKIEQHDGLPSKICHPCLFTTDHLSEFHERVMQNEEQLRNTFHKDASPHRLYSTDVLLPPENSVVMVVDPTIDYDSSENSESLCSDLDHEPELDLDLDSSGTARHGQSIDEPHEIMKNVFMCKYCDVAYTIEESCLDHEYHGHDFENPFACHLCLTKFDNRAALIVHIKHQHGIDKPYICVECKKGFGRRSDLKKHTIVHTGVRPYSCSLCNKHFSRNTNLTKHLRIHNGLKPHVCTLCPRSFSTRADLHRHTQIHRQNKPFKCSKCNATYSRREKLVAHERVHNASMPNVQTNSAVRSDTEKMVIALDPFADTIQQIRHSDENQHVTGDGAAAETISNAVLLGRPRIYECDKCPKRFPSKIMLLKHRHHHLSKRLHTCPECNKSFARKRELNRHSAIHTGLKPFECETCGKRFGRRDKLVRHQRIHLEEPQFPCTKCTAAFNRKDGLAHHMRVHSTVPNVPETPLANSQSAGEFLGQLNIKIERTDETDNPDAN